jgi:hypothetical protein
MHKLKENLKQELYEFEEKAERNPKAKMSLQELQRANLASDTLKNLCKIEVLEEGGGYSEESNWMADSRMYGTSYDDGSSYARDRRGNVKRDSMGRYSRDMMHHDGNMSYARDGRMGGMRGGYSRDEGKEEIMDMIDDMLEMADPEMKQKIHRFKKELERD